MAGFQEMASIAASSQFKLRVEYCLKKAAVAVMAEAAGTTSHAERVVYAKKVLDGSASVAEAAKSVVTNATVTAAGDSGAANMGIVDGDLEFTVNSMFNASLVTAADGTVKYDFQAADVTTAGTYYGWFRVHSEAGTEFDTYPKDGRSLRIEISDAA